MKNLKLTFIGGLVSVCFLIISIVFDMDLFEQLLLTLEDLEKYEIDELFIPFMIFFVFAFLDFIKWQKSHKVDLEKIKIHRAMMSSTHHVLNNFLNQMQLFKMTADDTPGFDPRVLSLYNQIINEASGQIEALGSLSEINESTIAAAVAPRPNIKTNTE